MLTMTNIFEVYEQDKFYAQMSTLKVIQLSACSKFIFPYNSYRFSPGAAHLQYVLSNADLPYESHQNKISSISKDLE